MSISEYYNTPKKRITFSPNYLPVDESQCVHKQCPDCQGTGVNKQTGEPCMHYIACRCTKCSLKFI